MHTYFRSGNLKGYPHGKWEGNTEMNIKGPGCRLVGREHQTLEWGRFEKGDGTTGRRIK
jgi:hypothetical protein